MSDLLLCTEVLYKDVSNAEDDLGLGGLRSLPDPALLTDSRVLENVLNGQQVKTTTDYFTNGIQQQIKPHMRKIVTEWMLEVTEEEKCSPEVFSLAVNYMDRVLSSVSIAKHQFQLLASVCIFLASKFKESSPLTAEKLVICSDFSFNTDEIMKWELMVLELLDWDLSAITPYCILDQLLRRLVQPLRDLQGHFDDLNSLRNYAETLLSLALTETEFMTVSPALVAVSSLITAMSSLSQNAATSSNPQVATFLHNLLDIVGLQVEEVAVSINNLESIIRTRIAIEQRCNNPISRYSPPPRQVNAVVKASTACVC